MNKRTMILHELSRVNSYARSQRFRNDGFTSYIHGGAAYRMYYGANAPNTPDIDLIFETSRPENIQHVKDAIRYDLTHLASVIGANAEFKNVSIPFGRGQCVFIGVLSDATGILLDAPLILVQRLTGQNKIEQVNKVPVMKKIPLMLEQLNMLYNLNSVRARHPLTKNAKYSAKVTKNMQRVRLILRRNAELIQPRNRKNIANALSNIALMRMYGKTPKQEKKVRNMHTKVKASMASS